MTLSRDAQIIAVTFFSLGKVCIASFGKSRQFTERANDAFAELEANGMIERVASNDLISWKATNKIGRPMMDYARPDKYESFDIWRN